MKNKKKEIFEKWKPIIESNEEQSRTSWFEKYTKQQISSSLGVPSSLSGQNSSQFPSIFPLVRKVAASTIAGGGTRKSKEQQLREDRLNKLRNLEGKKPNVTLPDDIEIPGLVSVKPLSAPSGQLLFIDYKYQDIKKIRMKKLQEIEKKQKISDILESLKQRNE